MSGQPYIGPVLVVGGCGFVGSHIVRYFHSEGTFPDIVVVSRSATGHHDQIKGIRYLDCDIKNEAQVRTILSDVKPVVVINTASPSPITGTPKEYNRVAIDGTKLLLRLATESPQVRAFVYTSSSTLAKGKEHVNFSEDVPLADVDRNAPKYAQTKARAELMVLGANAPPPFQLDDDASGYLKTGSIRLPIVYGTHDPWTIPGCLRALKDGQQKIRIGNGLNEWHFCSSNNSSKAHFLLVRSLLSEQSNGRVDGQAFNITDGQPVPFWEFSRAIWKVAGYDGSQDRVFNIPVALLLPIADMLELCFRIATMGKKRPQQLGRQYMEYIAYTHTYDISKAKEMLGYIPNTDFEKQLEMAVQWQLEHRGWREQLRRRVKV